MLLRLLLVSVRSKANVLELSNNRDCLHWAVEEGVFAGRPDGGEAPHSDRTPVFTLCQIRS